VAEAERWRAAGGTELVRLDARARDAGSLVPAPGRDVDHLAELRDAAAALL
jgi:hypothetical protein